MVDVPARHVRLADSDVEAMREAEIEVEVEREVEAKVAHETKTAGHPNQP